MSYTNYPSAENNPPQEPRRDSRKLIYGILIAALLGTWGYIVYDKSKSKEQITQLQTQYSNVDSARNAVQQEYNEALARMDSLTGTNTKLQGELAQRKSDIDKLKGDIKHELGKKNADLSKAKSMIAEINGGKEKTTTTAKRVDVFRVSFELDQNRISPTGSKDLYVCVYGPDGKPITMPSNGSGTFQSRDEGEKVFTQKVNVEYDPSKAN